jgi:hypothetical protein
MPSPIKRWWQGVPVENDPNSAVIFLNAVDRHWTAQLGHDSVRWHRDNWAKFWPIVIAALALALLAYKFFGYGV